MEVELGWGIPCKVKLAAGNFARKTLDFVWEISWPI